MAQKPGIPKGTRDFSPAEVARRQYLMQVMRSNFEKYGYQPIETPSFENSETLMGKYGEEGDRLIFKILNSGNFFFDKNRIPMPGNLDFLLSHSADDLDKDNLVELNRFTSKISEKALRYDLTVPFARYVVQHQNDIQFPFKRYQIQPVWRADRPQSGRFREFYQCDADVVGSDSLWQEVELVQLYDAVFTQLGLKNTCIRINNRKILSGIADTIGAADKLIDFTVALDKLDKIGVDGVVREMTEKGIAAEAIEKLSPLFDMKGDFGSKLDQLEALISTSEEGKKGIAELKFINENIQKLGLETSVLELDLTLARGLNYYTGAIFEVVANGVEMGSIGGGGRYDDLTGIFGLKGKSGVGISFGLDRIYIVLEKLELFPESVQNAPLALFTNFGTSEAEFAMKAVSELRRSGLRVELYPDAAKPAKQFTYAEKKGIPFVISAGEQELQSGTFQVKRLATGEKSEVAPEKLHDFLLEAEGM